MNPIGFTGERSGGKSAMSDIILEIHGNKNGKSTEQSVYDLSAGSANTDAKLGNAVSKTTYPVVLSEYGTIEKYGRDEKIVETFKNVIDRTICRHGRKDGIFDYPFASLSPLVLNGNSLISKKPEVVKRFHWSKYSQADRHEKNDPKTVEYNQLMESRRHDLKILGDWTINYVWNNQQELLLSKKYNAYQLMEILINKFYEFAEVEKPEWLNRWIDENALEELDIDELSIVRSILRTHIHETLRINSHLLNISNEGIVIPFETRVEQCLKHNLFSFIRAADGKYLIDSSILILFENRLPDMTLKRLGEMLGLNYSRKNNGIFLECTTQNMKEILL